MRGLTASVQNLATWQKNSENDARSRYCKAALEDDTPPCAPML
jgi:hypothetical protein